MEYAKCSVWLSENDRIRQSCANQRVIKILSANSQLKSQLQSGNYEDFFGKCFYNMQELSLLAFSDLTETKLLKEVLTITFEATSLSMQMGYSNYFNFAKLCMRILKNNSEIVSLDEDIGRLPLTFVCKDLLWAIKNTKSSSIACQLRPAVDLIAIHQTLIRELLKMFPRNICETPAMIETYLELQTNSNVTTELKEKFKDLLLNHQRLYGNFKQFFSVTLLSNDVSVNFYQLSFEIAAKIFNENLLMDALPTDTDSNFCIQLIMSVSENPHIIDMSLFGEIIEQVMEILYEPTLESRSFQFLEKSIIEGLFSDDFWMSVTCFHVICEFLRRLNSCEAARTYFKFFHDILIKIWNGADVQFLPQLFVMSIVHVIVNVHEKFFDAAMTNNFKKIFHLDILSTTLQDRFLSSFEDTLKNPTAINYHQLTLNLKLLGRKPFSMFNQTLQKFSLLLNMSKQCDWTLHSVLIASIMEVMIAAVDPLNMSFFILAIDLSQNRARPLSVTLKLIELISAYAPLTRRTTYLPELFKIELAGLMIDVNFIVKVAVKRLFSESCDDPFVIEMRTSLNFDHNLALDQIDNLVTQRLAVSKKAKTTAIMSKDLLMTAQMCLEYSEWLRDHPLQGGDRQIVQQIIRNLVMANK